MFFSWLSAATSKANNTNVNIDETVKRGYWKNKRKKFQYHDKNITEFAPDDIEFNNIWKC